MRAVALLLLATACVDTAGEYRCTSDPDCTLDGREGLCVRQPQDTTGYCAFADTTCGDGAYRYHEHSGSRAKLCTYPLNAPIYTLAAHLEDATDKIMGCGGPGAREAQLEIFVPGRQFVYFDTPDATIDTRIGISPGACPASTVICEPEPRPCQVPNYDQRGALLEPGLWCIVVEQADASAPGQTVNVRVIPTQRDGVLQPGAQLRMTCDQNPDPQTASCAAPANPRAVFFGFGLCPNASYATSFQVSSNDFKASVSLRGLSPFGGEISGACSGGACCKSLPSVPGTTSLDAVLPGPGPYAVVVERASAPPDCGTFTLTASITPM